MGYNVYRNRKIIATTPDHDSAVDRAHQAATIETYHARQNDPTTRTHIVYPTSGQTLALAHVGPRAIAYSVKRALPSKTPRVPSVEAPSAT